MTEDDLRAQRLLDALDLPDEAAKILERPEYRTVAFCRLLHHLRGDRYALEGLKRFHRAAIAEALSLQVLRSTKGVLKSRIRPTI